MLRLRVLVGDENRVKVGEAIRPGEACEVYVDDLMLESYLKNTWLGRGLLFMASDYFIYMQFISFKPYPLSVCLSIHSLSYLYIFIRIYLQKLRYGKSSS